MALMLCGKNEKFISFLQKALDGQKELKIFTDTYACLKAAVEEAPEVLFLLPDYDEGKMYIEEYPEEYIELLAEVVNNDATKIYWENYQSYDMRDYYITNVQITNYSTKTGLDSFKLTGSLKEELDFDVLQKRNAVYLPGFVHSNEKPETLIEIKNLLGVHTVIAESKEVKGVGLVKTNQNVYASMFDLTNYTQYYTLPYKNWNKLYSKLFSEITGVSESAFDKSFVHTYSKIETEKPSNYKYSDAELKGALEKAIKKAVEWHQNSGILLEEDGGIAVYEMIRSFDLGFAKNVRGDASFMTAVLFGLAGKYFNNEEWIGLSEKITNEMFNKRKLQITEGENKGVFKWFAGIKGTGSHTVWASDNARVANCVCALYKTTKNPKLKESALMYGEALLTWFGGKEYVPRAWFNYDNNSIVKMQSEDIQADAPEYYDAIMLVLRNLYEITGDERYRDQILKTAKAIADSYPNYSSGPSHSKNFTYGRVLGVLAVAQSFGDGKWTEVLLDLLKYFKNLQQECGGCADGEAYFDENSLNQTMEFAVGFGPEYGHICDLMYCQNTLLQNINVLRKSGVQGEIKELADDMFRGIMSFLLNVQIVSDDKKISGGWMRAYDMDLDEYYGCNKDFAWGAYSILVGWMTGSIPIVFLDVLGLPSLY